MKANGGLIGVQSTNSGIFSVNEHLVKTKSDVIRNLDVNWTFNRGLYNTTEARRLKFFRTVGAAEEIHFSPDGKDMYVAEEPYITHYRLGSAYDITTLAKVDKVNIEFRTTGGVSGTSEYDPRGVALSSDGTKMYVAGAQRDNVYQFDLSTPFDISTADWLTNQIYIDIPNEGNPYVLRFSPDGIYMFVGGTARDGPLRWTLSTAWDLSTASYDGSITLSSDEGNLRSFDFKPDGTKMFTIGTSNDSIKEYTLTTPWDSSTATYVQSVDCKLFSNGPLALTFNNDGTKIFMIDADIDNMMEIPLSTAYDITTIGNPFDENVATLRGYIVGLSGLWFKPDGTKFYVTDSNPDTIEEFSLSTAWDLSTISNSAPVVFDVTSSGATSPKGIFFKSDGLELYIVCNTSDAVYQFTLTTAWDITTCSLTTSFSVATQDDNPHGIYFKSDGTEMYITGNTGNKIIRYTLSTGWDLSTASSTSDFSVGSQESGPLSVVFNTGGTEMYVVGNSGDDLNVYTLSTAWDITTASFSNEIDFLNFRINPGFLHVKPDGTKFYVVDTDTESIHGFDLETAWDFSSVQLRGDAFRLENTDPQSVYLSDDGNNMYVLSDTDTDSTYRGVLRYSLSTSYDITTASYVSYYNTGAVNNDVDSLLFSSDGTKFYVTGQAADRITQYNMSTPFDITSVSSNVYIYVNDDPFRSIVNPRGLTASRDGKNFYVLDSLQNEIVNLTLRTAWDITTAYYRDFWYQANHAGISGASSPGAQFALFFKPDGTKMYTHESSGDQFIEYTLEEPWQVDSAYATAFLDQDGNTGTIGPNLCYDIKFKPDGTMLFAICNTNDRVYQYNLTTAWDLSTASTTADAAMDVNAYEPDPRGFFFKPDGTELYIIGSQQQIKVFQLNNAWDITGGFSQGNGASFGTNNDMIDPRGLWFSKDGKKMFWISGSSNDAIRRASLSTAWDTSSSSVSSDVAIGQNITFDAGDIGTLGTPGDMADGIGHIDDDPGGFYINEDTNQLFVAGSGAGAYNSTGEKVWQADFGTSLDLTSLVVTSKKVELNNSTTAGFPFDNLDISQPSGLAIDARGKKIFFKGNGESDNNRCVYSLSLPTAFSLKNATNGKDGLFFKSESGIPLDFSFSYNGDRLYLASSKPAAVFQYVIGN